MTSFALSSSTQSFSCSHENPATQLDSREEYCVECNLQQEGSSVESALNLHEINRCEQESEPALSIDIPDEKGFSHQWTNRDGEYLEGVYDITNRLPSWLFLGKHVFPMFEPDEMTAYLALPSWAKICSKCNYQVNKYMGCLTCEVLYTNTAYRYRIA
jgi:hypothetical protein